MVKFTSVATPCPSTVAGLNRYIIASFFDSSYNGMSFPRPFGVIYSELRPTYEEGMQSQIDELIQRKGKPSLDKILSGNKTWTIL
mgnify:CR=1 FL=1